MGYCYIVIILHNFHTCQLINLHTFFKPKALSFKISSLSWYSIGDSLF